MTTELEYSDAILKLAHLAEGDTGGSRVAAQVLLSAYNGNDFQLNIVDLCNLDRLHYQAALSVILGRVELGIEPQQLLDNGDQVFLDLWERWLRYHVANRGLPDCPACRGTGLLCDDQDDEVNDGWKACSRCGGRGY